MSERARMALGWAAGSSAPLAFPLLRVQFYPLLALGTVVWMGILAGDPAVWSVGADLGPLEGRLLRQHGRLARLERGLSARARAGRGRGRTIRQVEAERQRIARELHAGVGQMLAAIRLQTEAIADQTPEPAQPVRQAAARIARLAQDGLEQVRAIAKRLRPPEWQVLPLESAIRQLWELSGIPQRFTAVLRVDPLPAQPEAELKSLFYRAAQEGVSNLARHSKGTRAELTLTVQDRSLVLTIWDDGPGFDVAEALAARPALDSGVGLRSIRNLAAESGGQFEIHSGPGGTRLVLSAPAFPARTQMPTLARTS